MMIVSYSELVTWDTCKRQYYYSYERNLKPITESDPIKLGNHGHSLLQMFYTMLQEGLSPQEARKALQAKTTSLMTVGAFPDFNLLKAWTLVDNYVREKNFKNTAVIVENRYLFPVALLEDSPMFKDLYIAFSPDVVFERPGGFLDVEDAKFVGRAWSQNKLDQYQQTKIYQILLNKMGYNVTRSTVRFFNVTKGEITSQPYILDKAEESIITTELLEGIHELVDNKLNPRATARRTLNYAACQYCAFQYPCKLESEGKSAEQTFATQYVVRTRTADQFKEKDDTGD